MYSLNVYSELITFPCINLICLTYISQSQIIIICILLSRLILYCACCYLYLQGESLARGPKLLSIKNYFIEIMTWKFIYTYREQCKTGPAHNWCWNWSPFTSRLTWMRFSKFWNTLPKVSTLTAWISSRSTVRGVFLYTLPFNRPPKKEVGSC